MNDAMPLVYPPAPDGSADCPCVGHCTTALGDDVCRSCLRTLDEVTNWPQMSDDERRAVNRRIAALHAREVKSHI
ncbi:MAG: DUF1289 domain-containing protein [Gallionellaceae bacterium]|jgi:predicted Fe-S protein YdhL (DUF1289 family)|nr:DUF1289 domain-containing protein [Gallionellaceae bacterium]